MSICMWCRADCTCSSCLITTPPAGCACSSLFSLKQFQYPGCMVLPFLYYTFVCYQENQLRRELFIIKYSNLLQSVRQEITVYPSLFQRLIRCFLFVLSHNALLLLFTIIILTDSMFGLLSLCHRS